MPAFLVSLKKYAVGMTAVFFLIVLLVVATSLRRSPVFQAEARINIPEIQSNEAVSKSSHLNSSLHEGITLQTAVEILQGNVLAEQVVIAIGRIKIFPDLDQEALNKGDTLSRVLAAFQQQLTVTPIKGTRIVRITFQHPNAAMSAQVVETLIRFFRMEYKKIQYPQEALQSEQLLLLRQNMNQAAQALTMFRQKNQLFLVGESKQEITAQYDNMQKRLSAEQENLQDQLHQMNRLEEQFADILKPHNQNSEQVKEEEFRQERKGLVRLKIYEQDLIDKYGEGAGGSGDRLIANVRLQAASLKKKLYTEADVLEAEQKQSEDAAEQVVLAKIGYREQQNKIDRLQRQISQLENKLQRVTEQNGVLKELQQHAEITRQRYTSLVEQLEMEQKSKKWPEQILVIEKPMKPLAPIKPQKRPVLLLAFACGLIGSLLYGMIQMLRKGVSVH
ncbi:G-rich domain on tyrosine kinase [Candidatus Electrothrix laxa]